MDTTSTTTTARVSRRAAFVVAVVGLVMVALAGCAPDVGVPAEAGAPGFWLGLWHGLISPVTFVISLFAADVGVYAVPNNGGWYDAGFMLGVSTVFSSAARRRSRRRRSAG